MSTARRLKAFKVILHAHQHDIDVLSAELAAIRAQHATIGKRIEDLNQRRDTEGHADSLEAVQFVAGFLQAIAAEQAVLSDELRRLEKTSEELEDRLRDKFIEHRGWQITCDRLQASIDCETRRSEEAELDEVARAMFTHGRRA